MAKHFDALIVGAGHGGAQTAIALRQRGFAGSIAIAGDEPEFPYERPPLSKDYLSHEKTFDRLLIRQPNFWTEREIEMRLGHRIVAIDSAARTVTDDAGEILSYSRLIWATGGTPRRLSCSGHDLGGVHSVRSRADVDQMIAELPRTRRVVVVGGGYIGLEAAAVLVKLGKSVTVVEALDRVLARVTGVTLSQFFEGEHRAHGVDLRLNIAVSSIEGIDGRVTGVRLADGHLIAADMVVVGIGIEPTVQPLIMAGAEVSNGVAVDEYCRTSLADIYALGDCALHNNMFAQGNSIRLESVQNANDMANVVACDITGTPEPYKAIPWFWSNQYDLRLQTVGISAGYDEAVTRGDISSRSFSIIYKKDSSVIALDCVNATRDYVHGRKLVANRARASSVHLADVSVDLNSNIFA